MASGYTGDARAYGITAFARDVLTVADNLARTIEHVSAEARASADPSLKALLDDWFAARGKEEAFAARDAAGAPVEIVCETLWIDEALWFDWLLDSNRVIENFQSMYGHVREYGLFNRLAKTPGRAAGPAPRLGEHTRALLAEVGYSDAEVDDLLARRIAIQPADVTGRIASKVNA